MKRHSPLSENISDVSPDPSTWVDKYGDYLFRFALLRVRDRTVAEDVVQETFFAALKSRQTFHGKSSFSTWLVGILRNKIIDHFRQSGRNHTEEYPEASGPDSAFLTGGEWRDHWDSARGPREWSVDSSDEYERQEFMAILGICLKHLPERLAAVFSMREIDGIESDEVCKVLAISPSNLWVMLHRGRMHLRKCLESKWLIRKHPGHEVA